MIADKATHQRWTRQLIGLITLNPGAGGDNLLVPVFLGCPRCPRGDGEYLTQNIASVTDKYVEGCQCVGFTGDGAYIKCKVSEKLELHYNTPLTSTWDQMHRGGTVDTAMRKLGKFNWLHKLTAVIGKAVKFVAWGKEFAHFFRVAQELEDNPDFDFKLYMLVPFSETKFANSAEVVYFKLREEYPALVITLEEVKEDLHNGNSTERAKADKAAEVQSGIMNYTFCLSLSAVVDIYRVYGSISKILQIINLLPHERYQMFQEQLGLFQRMLDNIDYKTCSCKAVVEGEGVEDGDQMAEKCPWPTLHQDINEVLLKGKYRGCVLGQLVEDSACTRDGRRQEKIWLEESRESTVAVVLKRAQEVAKHISEELREKVYDQAALTMLNHSRRLLNVKSDLEKIKANSAAEVSNLGWKGFKAAAEFFDPDIISRVTEGELRQQYREYNRKLEQLTHMDSNLNLGNKEIIALFFDPAGKKYVDIEAVLSVLARACVSQGVEAVVESWVSVLENHASSVRCCVKYNLHVVNVINRGIQDQQRLENELWVAINGPEVVQCESIVREALKKDGSNFIRRSENIKSWQHGSKAVTTLVSKAPKIPFMV